MKELLILKGKHVFCFLELVCNHTPELWVLFNLTIVLDIKKVLTDGIELLNFMVCDFFDVFLKQSFLWKTMIVRQIIDALLYYGLLNFIFIHRTTQETWNSLNDQLCNILVSKYLD